MELLKYLFAVIVGATVFTLVMYLLQVKYPNISVRYQVVTLEGDTFDLNVKVLITDDTAFALRYVREHLDSTAKVEDFDARAVTFPTIGGKSPIVWLPQNTPIEIVNHELLHATISVMAWAGIALSDSTEEVYAYELQHLSKQFYNQIKPIK